MISIFKIGKENVTESNTTISVELRGLSTDTKPTEINERKVANGSVFIEIDTGDLYFFDFDNQEWKVV